MEIQDSVFLTLAARLGLPTSEEIASLQAAQADPATAGTTLFKLACSTGVLKPAQIHVFLRDSLSLEEPVVAAPPPVAAAPTSEPVAPATVAPAPAPVVAPAPEPVAPEPVAPAPVAAALTPEPIAAPPAPVAVAPAPAPAPAQPGATPAPATPAPSTAAAAAPTSAPRPVTPVATARGPAARPSGTGPVRRSGTGPVARPAGTRPGPASPAPAASAPATPAPAQVVAPPAAAAPAAPAADPAAKTASGARPARRTPGSQAALAGRRRGEAEPGRPRAPKGLLLIAATAGTAILGGLIAFVVMTSKSGATPDQTASATEGAGAVGEKPAVPKAGSSKALARVKQEEAEIRALLDEGSVTLAQERLDGLLQAVEGDPAAVRAMEALRRDVAVAIRVEQVSAEADEAKARKAEAEAKRKAEEKAAKGEEEEEDPFEGIDARAPDPNKPFPPSDEPEPAPDRGPAKAPEPRPARPEPADEPDEAGEEDDEEPMVGGGQARRIRKPGEDPVPPLGPDDAAVIRAGLAKKGAIEGLVARFVERAETAYLSRNEPPEGFKAWLAGQPELRRAFWLALDPAHDLVPRAVRVLDELRRLDAAAVAAHPQLAVAFAVVWDDPEMVEKTRKDCLYEPEAWEQLPTLADNFRYFTDPKNKARFQFQPDALTWPLLVYAVDMDLSPAEIAWGIEKYLSRRSTISSAYGDLVYDDDKRKGLTPKMGKNTYNLMNLRKYGGVCGDQSHFATRLAKLFCIPATKVQGVGITGGVGHAWYGALTTARGKPELEFSGRYWDDYYYTGDVLDPQRGTDILDRHLAMTLDGASTSYPRFMESLVLARMAQRLLEDQPALSIDLASAAVKQNQYCGPAWLLLMEHVRRGNATPQVGLGWVNDMFKALAAHPDVTLPGLVTFTASLPADDVKRRAKLYDTAGELYRKSKRPDLHLELATRQSAELEQLGDPRALEVALATATEWAKEGRRVLPLVKIADRLARERGKLRQVIPAYERIRGIMPKFRDDVPAQAYQEFLKVLLAAYETAGMKEEAKKLREQEKMD